MRPLHLLQRRFAASDTIATVRDYLTVTAAELGVDIGLGFELATNMPRRTYAVTDSELDLRAAGLHPQAMLFVTRAAVAAAAPPA
jgi:hypothetical protein